MGVAEVRFEPDALDALGGYAWPGNIRELMNAIERAVALGGDVVALEHLPEKVLATTASAAAISSESISSLDDVERRHVFSILERVGGNKGKAAELLGIDLSTLYRKLRRYESET